MNIFQGNTKLEEAIFTGLDYALWSRNDIGNPFTPFMMLHKNGKSKLIRMVGQGNPEEHFERTLDEERINYDQIIMCLEGRVPHNEEKHDAIIVKGFDTSQEYGLIFIQRFRGKESGLPFMKLGNPALVSNKEKLPVPLVPRETNKKVDDPYISGMLVSDDHGNTNRVIIAGHHNASILANYLFNTVLNSLDKNEEEFSGQFLFNFVPGTIDSGPFSRFIFDQLIADLKNNPTVKSWEEVHGKELTILLKFEDENGRVGENVSDEEATKTEDSKADEGDEILSNKLTENLTVKTSSRLSKKPWWKFW